MAARIAGAALGACVALAGGCWGQGLDRCGHRRQPRAIVALEPQAACGRVELQHRIVAGGPELGHGRRSPGFAGLHPAAGLVRQPAHPVAAAGHHRRQRRERIPGAGLPRQAAAAHHLQRRQAHQAAAPQGGAVAIEPDQAVLAVLIRQHLNHHRRIPPGNGAALQPTAGPQARGRLDHGAWWLARSGRPASIRAASRMRQLSHTPQGPLPPL